ncbi:unnamed protein product [Bursaphelenchus okinawaensis]|uniref:Origin recognition complex subunit 5 C-terminal domain-containing protein n=1 Tax=Bursaphelenchus okinawaensis TaxID=465554 RepID=A0A811KQI8_9BILA|nr:unnamed protein product [Bursaphelenchus okinawaensis]CAG9111598.1 unnamed protein product [Bursaphelenchus okinawaensis]
MEVVERFARDSSGICFHLHVHGQKIHLDTLTDELKDGNGDTLAAVTLHLRLFLGNEKEVFQFIGEHFGAQVSSVRVLDEVLNLYFGDNPKTTLLILIRDAEEFNQFRFGFLKELFFACKERKGKVKLITMGCFPWKLISDGLKERFYHNIMHYKFEPMSTQMLEIYCMRGVTKNGLDYDIKTIRYVLSLLPKNLDPFVAQRFLIKILQRAKIEDVTSIVKNDQWNSIVKRIVDSKPKAQLTAQPVYDKLPHIAALTLIASYFASYNPPSTDKRYFGEKASCKRRATQRTVVRENYHETGPKPFTLERLCSLYTSLKAAMIAECGDIDVRVHVPFLLHRGHLEKVSDIHNVAIPKFRCVAPFDYVNLVKDEFLKHATKKTNTKDDNFDLRQYLHDFALETQ